ncbi:hypothetical protein DFH28DRAFT_989704 [Melampsora americana]|nr:hypothetical protein DFH28DRAFT_989704 [Melampsora americana]
MFFTRTTILITFGFLMLIKFGNSKKCTKAFTPNIFQQTTLCTDKDDTYEYPIGDCTYDPSQNKGRPPVARKCAKPFDRLSVNCHKYNSDYPLVHGTTRQNVECYTVNRKGRSVSVQCDRIDHIPECTGNKGVLVPRVVR